MKRLSISDVHRVEFVNVCGRAGSTRASEVVAEEGSHTHTHTHTLIGLAWESMLTWHRNAGKTQTLWTDQRQGPRGGIAECPTSSWLTRKQKVPVYLSQTQHTPTLGTLATHTK